MPLADSPSKACLVVSQSRKKAFGANLTYYMPVRDSTWSDDTQVAATSPSDSLAFRVLCFRLAQNTTSHRPLIRAHLAKRGMAALPSLHTTISLKHMGRITLSESQDMS